MNIIKQYNNGRRNFRDADLRDADLSDADLRCADLSDADLSYANLKNADLSYADLRGADLKNAHLSDADLRRVDLRNANLRGADLSGTCLDLNSEYNSDLEGFERLDDQWIIGYRTKNSPHYPGPNYNVGDLRSVDLFSTSDTECHPGLYVCPTIDQAKRWGKQIVKVIFQPHHLHRAGRKWRVKELIVWEEL
jgi:uncharacterized protein YjbI with pentapeptide repeats